jgi:ribosomal-protein-alanine N-acetyltransferase
MIERIKDLVIERMALEDMDEVVKIENQSFSDPWKREFFSEEIRNNFASPLVAKLDQKVVGYACLWIFFGELQIANIAVEKDFRRRGIGRKILERIIAYARDKSCLKITLDVRESNREAIDLYNKFGFKIAGRRKKYYRFPVEDSLIMEKILL